MNRFNLKESIQPLDKLSLLQIKSSHSSPIKRNIKFNSSKLPTDFFSQNRKKLHLHDLNIMKTNINVRQYPSRQQTKSRTSTKKLETCQTAESSRTKELTDASFLNNDEQLIIKLIETTRDIKRMIRKHSMQVRKCSKDKNQMQFELPPLKTTRTKYTA